MIIVPQPSLADAPRRVEAVVLDWAGTTVDFGSRAPILAILEALEQAGVPVTEQEARRPMGRAKRDHLQALVGQPAVAQRWRRAHGRDANEADIDRLYERFLVRQPESIVGCSGLIPGCREAVDACRAQGIKIGSSTGYTRGLLAPVAERARFEGYAPDVMLTADDVGPGRPAPWLCMENAKRLGVYPMQAVVKVDDTPAGVAAGRNAGAWSVGVVASGNEVGLSREAYQRLGDPQREPLLEAARRRLAKAGAQLLIDTIAELPEAIAWVNDRLANPGRPIGPEAAAAAS
ncbi:Phosphonoacetaldehyde hydrolase [Pirellulimonas nuda]|uniref:Phosphonoacetaldehyde hydrolase n=1 Tax=Pirellulimonas nuda TaxID=2528009 RepID=A0A518DDI9_9BACT|nr:phosphonoacetaldehyde hydrolase [Pirellulimonas nuda]QDU89523.1 Phosphonoacetaldehyde hydrolase [Pirellulimonas nuda]